MSSTWMPGAEYSAAINSISSLFTQRVDFGPFVTLHVNKLWIFVCYNLGNSSPQRLFWYPHDKVHKQFFGDRRDPVVSMRFQSRISEMDFSAGTSACQFWVWVCLWIFYRIPDPGKILSGSYIINVIDILFLNFYVTWYWWE